MKIEVFHHLHLDIDDECTSNNMIINMLISVFIVTLSCLIVSNNADKRCAAKEIKRNYIVCVCNTTYCDTVTRNPPPVGKFTVVISSEIGYRFYKTVESYPSREYESAGDAFSRNTETVKLNPNIKYQTIQGFGGAVTDSTGINWKNFPQALQNYFIQSYFSKNGLEYNMIRIAIGGTDFGNRTYVYNEYPRGEVQLTNYTLAQEDLEYKIPIITAGNNQSTDKLHIIASPWEAPTWMQKKNQINYGFIQQKYFDTYADYILKFLKLYKNKGINVTLITTANEPTNGILGIGNLNNTLAWTPCNMAQWIVNNLGPKMRNSEFNDIKLLVGDDQRETIPLWINEVALQNPEVLNYVDGVATHYYEGTNEPPTLLDNLLPFYPKQFRLATQTSAGSLLYEKVAVDLGSWSRAESYIQEIMANLNFGAAGWIDFNMCLNKQGGPNWGGQFADSPIIAEKNEFYKQPMFYAIGHFSKYIPRGSQRINVTASSYWGDFTPVAFTTPKNTTVTIIYNKYTKDNKRVKIQSEGRTAIVHIPPRTIATIEM